MAADAASPRARVEDEPTRTGLTRLIGVEVDDVRPGHGGTLARAARSELRQVSGVVPGGVPATLPDHAVGTASASALPPDRVAAKADVQTAYLATVASEGVPPLPVPAAGGLPPNRMV